MENLESSVGKVCLHCGYVRKENEPVAENRCPKCRAPYAVTDTPEALMPASSKPPAGPSLLKLAEMIAQGLLLLVITIFLIQLALS